ncbi:tetratricopeptide repeat protein [Helicobacter pylori]|uniref:tetratricopeptide repeat protein n=1 Tax=Helicobacter pylori TaxID=210 RepID=UPI000EAD8D8F|nr:tetratricopeptide repeat protein [Helicobacter pylori]
MSVKKAVFRVLYLGVLCLCVGLMAEQDPKELIFSGITIYYTDKNSTRAKRYFEKACGLNDADGCIILREIYSKAITRENARESIEEALEHTATAKACKLNDAKGCMLSATFYDGVIKGFKKDKKAFEYYSKACGLNYSDGCVILGDIYHSGEGVTKNFKKAFEYFDKACQLNNAKGCYALAALYNEGVAKDEKQMTENLKKACGLGLKEACDILKEQK